ncbi:hypothetical protein [uncultured Roseibium sp.]|uniref:hypothetical protein n=1 Tax=uncultured Roseibium sp. TaxID=1936171 RepID=UPI0026128C15|nr:hypothetical protein [uncultured Roseibium sp.]
MRKRRKFLKGELTSEHEKLLYEAHFQLIEKKRDFPKECVPEYGSKWWLPIDEVIKKIASRNRPPKLRPKTENSRYALLIWRVFGPYGLARNHIEMAFSAVATLTPERREMEIEESQRFLENCDELRRALAEFSNIEIQSFVYFYSIMRNLSKEEFGFRMRFTYEFFDCLGNLDSYLEHFERWAGERYDAISPPQGGKPKSEWRHEFVFRMSHLWFLLTGEDAPSGPNTIFMEFLEAAWACGGDNMPDVAWEATVRAVNSRRQVKDDVTSGSVH